MPSATYSIPGFAAADLAPPAANRRKLPAKPTGVLLCPGSKSTAPISTTPNREAASRLILLHGNSSYGEAWFQQFEHFSDRFRVIAYDSVNHGHSSNSPRDAEEPDRADELGGFLAAMHIERPILAAGNSMGGNTLLRWATRHPSDARALIPSGMGVAPEGTPAMPAAAPRASDHETLFLPIGDSLTDGFKAAKPRMFERYLRIRSTATRLEALRHPRTPSARTRAERTSMAEKGRRHRLADAHRGRGMNGPVRGATASTSLVPASEYEVIAGAPHNVYYEAAAAYNARVDTFLARCYNRWPNAPTPPSAGAKLTAWKCFRLTAQARSA